MEGQEKAEVESGDAATQGVTCHGAGRKEATHGDNETADNTDARQKNESYNEEQGIGDREEEEGVEVASPKFCGICPRWEFTFQEYLEEMKIILHLSWPNILCMLLESLMTIMAVLFSGHLGTNELAAASFANSITTVFTRAIGHGFTSSCETLFTQFYGSPRKYRIGVILQRGMLIMSLLCFVCWGILINSETLLLLAQQNSEVARLTGMYCLIYIPAVPGDYLAMLLVKYLQCQSRLIPVVVALFFTNALAAVIYYILIYVFHLGLIGTAIAQVLAHYILVFLLLGYILWKKLYKETWKGWSKDCLDDWMPIFKLGVAGCLMVCLEWWSFDLGFYLAGLINEESVGAHAIIMYTSTTGEMLPYGIGTAAAIRIGNSLGAKKPGTAHVASIAALSLGLIPAIILAILETTLRNEIPYIFTSDSLTVELASSILPICALFAVLDATGGVCGGVIRGTGRQAVGAAVNMIGYYLIGLPLGISLMFPLEKGIYGFWSGITFGLLFQAVFLLVFTLRLDWKKETRKAQKRIGHDKRVDNSRPNAITANCHAASQTDLEKSEEEESLTGNGNDTPANNEHPHVNGECGISFTDATSNTDETYEETDGLHPASINGYHLVPAQYSELNENANSCHQFKHCVTNGQKINGITSDNIPSITSFWEIAQLRVLFLCISIVYLALAITCRVLVVPPLRTIAIDREMSMANVTDMTTMLSQTEAVRYSEVM